MLSDWYRTDTLISNCYSSNPDVLCRLAVGCSRKVGTLLHILLHCPALIEARANVISHWSAFLVPRPWLLPTVAHYTLNGDHLNLQFLLDPSVLPLVISSSRETPDVMKSCFYLARTWNFSIHLARQKMRKLWNLKN